MPYVSHPVRHVRDDPVEGETVDLLVRTDDADVEQVADALRDLGARDVEDRGLGALSATVPQPAVAAVCDLDGLDAVETTNTLEMDLDGAGEDVDL